MYPYLFGNENLEMYYIFIGIGIISAFIIFRHLTSLFDIPTNIYNFYMKLGAVSIFLGFAFAISFQQVYNYIHFIKSGEEFSFQGMTFFGGLIGGVLTFVLGTYFFGGREHKNVFWKVCNLGALSIVVAHFFGRIGCTFAGCCYGIETDSIIGMYFHTVENKVLPTQLMEAIFLLLVSIFMIILLKKKKEKYLLIFYGFSYSIWRFIIEYYRGDERGDFLPFFSPSQWQSILLFIVSLIITVSTIKYKRIPFKKD
ncbi:MAG: prolipoprotein diacylglyceryl transferase [Acholeplasmatales bacterium]|jgi:phosphatidylglycerol:prolipoprotein diacylglycerol transferase|nr:prolipoprotein diacylglyceryl transferase [Acholeplasmatales bacterium]